MAYYIQPVKRLAEELDDDVTEDMLNTKTFEEEDSEIDISHFGSFEILQSKDEMRIRAAARAKELDAFREKIQNKSKTIREKAEAKAKRTENFLKLREDMKMQARFINDQQSRERARLKETAEKLLSSGKLLEPTSFESLTNLAKNSSSLQNIDINDGNYGMMLGFQNSSLWDNDKVLVEEGDEYYDDEDEEEEDGQNILDIEDEDGDDDDYNYATSPPKDSLDKVVIDFETGEKIKLINKHETKNKNKFSKQILHSASSILSSNVYNDYLMQQKQQRLNNSKSSSQFFDDYDNTSSIISIKNRPNTVQSLRREKQAQITMQTKRPRPSYGKKNTEIINERIERIRLARTKTANPTKKNPRDPKPLLSDFATSSSSGFLPGPKARRKLGRSARHANTANLAHRDIEQPQPKTFFQKEFAKHSNQSFTLSNNKNNSNQLLDGFEQLEGLRQRQLADMDRLLKEERAVEVERQAMEASDTSTKRRRRLRLKFMKDREKSRHRILRIAKEHELALASRMAAMGLIR